MCVVHCYYIDLTFTMHQLRKSVPLQCVDMAAVIQNATIAPPQEVVPLIEGIYYMTFGCVVTGKAA